MRILPLFAVAILALTTLPATVRAQAPVNPANAPETAPAQRMVSVPELRQIANRAYAEQNYPAFLQAVSALHELRPWNSDYMSYVVLANALNGNKSAAYEMMLYMQQQGLAGDFNSTDDSLSIRGTEAYEYINDLMVRANDPMGVAELKMTLPGSVLAASDIEWDPTREAFLVSDPRQGAIFRVGRDGTTEELISADEDNGLWAVYGLIVDPDNNRLWVSSAASPEFAGLEETDAGRSALFEFSLDELELVKVYPVPADGRPHRLGAITRVSNGDIYGIDSFMPIVYRLKSGDDLLKRFAASGDNVYLRDITASDDGSRLYLADYELGITVFDLAGKQAAKVAGPETLNFGGIEGLDYWDGHLVMTQSGISPQRILRLKLSADGASVEEVAPLAVAQPFFDHPSSGTLLDGSLWFIANSYGTQNAVQPESIRIAVAPVETAPDLMAPDLDKFWDEYYESRGMERPDQPAEDS
jgi:hypothetical protein